MLSGTEFVREMKKGRHETSDEAARVAARSHRVAAGGFVNAL